MVLHLHLSPAVFDYTDWTWLGKPHTCLYKTLQLTVHVRANENHEVKGTARRAQRQNCGKAQIWPRLQKNSAALKVPKSTVASIIKNFLALILSGMCGENQALLITCPIQSQQWSMVVAASCCGGVFQLQGQDDWLQSRGKMNAAKYRDILDENLLQSAQDLRLGRRFTFQQDKDPKHTAK